MVTTQNRQPDFISEARTDDFDFELPESAIAQMPLASRDAARLLHVTADGLGDRHIRDLPDLLQRGDLLVLNDTKVIPARLYGQRGAVRVEILLHRKQESGTWLAFARPGKRLRIGDTVIFAPDFSAAILEKRESGEVVVRFIKGPSFRTPRRGDPESHLFSIGKEINGILGSVASQQPRNDAVLSDTEFFSLLALYGEPPLPPYIKRGEGQAKQDQARYQTVYAAHEGAVAAPTAGLHFTPELFAKLHEKGIRRTTVTLHVGAGTFLPVKAERVKDHVMHAEWGEISAGTAEAINHARREGRRIVAVGTTSLRLLESAADEGGIIHPFRGETDIFITPGYRFRAVDALVTNFHLPKSTLFMLVCAFAGMERMKAAYAHAITSGYRFYSYGDATLLERAL